MISNYQLKESVNEWITINCTNDDLLEMYCFQIFSIRNTQVKNLKNPNLWDLLYI